MEEDEFRNDGFEAKSPSAIDFYDINELCDEVAEENGVPSSDSESEEESSNTLLPFYHKLNFFKQALNNSESTIIPDKPLASVFPMGYQDIDVNELFPDFRDGQVLRFLRLFGPGKKSNMPDIWRSVRKRIAESKNNLIKHLETKECEVESDEEIKFLLHKVRPERNLEDESTLNGKPLDNAWRFGPAKLWYDMVEVPETAETYDYGFKLKDEASIEEVSTSVDVPDESYLLVSQSAWEENVIWDGDEVKDEVMKNVYNSNKAAGWIPVSSDRTVASFQEHCRYVSSRLDEPPKIPQGMNRIFMNKLHMHSRKDISHSLFPEENTKLLYDKWEDDVIWDSDAMVRISYPKPVEIDRNINLQIPDDKPPPSPESLESVKDRKDKKFRPGVKKPEEEELENSNPVNIRNDFYNISNDEYYNPKITQETALKLNCGGSLLQHSTPALELRPQLFPTYMGPIRLRRFHRPTLKQYSHGPLSEVDFHGVESLTNHIRQKERERKRELEESGGGEMFYMRTASDLSGKDGDLVLFEFSEEHPPLMVQVGMASRIRNYYRRRPGKEAVMQDYKYGEIAYAHTSPFLGTLQPGQSVQAYENHLFRAPMFEHSIQPTDFLIIRTRYTYLIRELETIYTVGQQLPLVEVPSPKSEKASNFMRDFLMVYIYRLFGKSLEVPPRVRMEVIKKAFPSLREFSIRKRLNLCADFQRTGSEPKFWMLKQGFRLPSEEEIRQMVSPEQCCAFYSMLAAEQRLKDAGYGDKFLLMAEEENDLLQNKIDDEVKAAPWNTTQSFLSAIRGKCMLELSGSADPTGCGEGFSYIKVSSKPQWSKDDNYQNPAKRLVKGTDADLRRLSLSSAKKLLKSFNVSDREIKNMTRWQVIDVVRTLSTEQAKMGEEGVTKFARGNLFSQAEHLRRYKEECQRLFDLQNRVLSNNEVLSTDEDSSSEEDSDLEEMGKHIENLLSNKKSIKQLSHECEEAERKELQKLMSSEADDSQKGKVENKMDEKVWEGKILKIYRTYRNANGGLYERVETVRKEDVIQLYMKIRESKDDSFIRNFSLDEDQKEAFRREKRRIQDQLRRIKRNEMKGLGKEPPKKRMKIEALPSFKVKCGACGATGHMRTNRACPLYQASTSGSLPPIQVAMTEEQEEAAERTGLEDQNLIKVDETKIIVSKQLIKHADEVRRQSLVLKIPKEAVANANKKRKYNDESFEYTNLQKGIHRKRVDPVVSISVIFEKLVSEIKALANTQPFWSPVNEKVAPNYYSIIKTPMDLLTMKDKARKQKYRSREDFLKDLQQILDNSNLYNGNHSYLSMTANEMIQHCFKKFSEDEEKFMELEKTINPLLDNDLVAFSFILETIVNDYLKTVPESWPFHKPVDKRLAKGYYETIKYPMDLGLLIRNCKANKYKTVSAFRSDVELIYSNSVVFNGASSQFTKIAGEIVNACDISLDMYSKQLARLEDGVKELGYDDLSEPAPRSPPRRIKHAIQPSSQPKLNVSNCNGSADSDMFVDVEAVDLPIKSSSEKDFHSSDIESVKYENEESNSSFIFSDSRYDFKPGVPASPTDTKSLLNINGVIKADNSSNQDNIHQSYSQITCDTICDDLMLSETDSDEELHTVDPLQF